MFTIEFKKAPLENSMVKDQELVIVNGILDKNSFALTSTPISVHVEDKDIIDILINHSFKEVGQSVSKLIFPLEVEWWEENIDVDIYCNTFFKQKFPSIAIDLSISNLEHWNKPWSISDLAKQFEINTNLIEDKKINYWQEDEEHVLSGFGLIYLPSDNSLVIKSELDYLLSKLKSIVEQTHAELIKKIDKEAVLTYFQFPEEIKYACKQYLVYFSQFIADMGIDVKTELTEELNHTLFKVIPKSKDESLNRIREALNIYLNAPAEKDFEIAISRETDIAVKQWESNYYHLKSQLSLAKSIIQSKNSTIEMLQLSNFQYKQLLESRSNQKVDKNEKIFSGLVEIKKIEVKGFNINLPEIFRKLKRVWNK